MKKSDMYLPAVRVRAVRVRFEQRAEHSSPPRCSPRAQHKPPSTDGGALEHSGSINAVADSDWDGAERTRLGPSDADWQRG